MNECLKRFEFTFVEFAGDIHEEIENGFEPYTSEGFTPSCFGIQFDVLEVSHTLPSPMVWRGGVGWRL